MAAAQAAVQLMLASDQLHSQISYGLNVGARVREKRQFFLRCLLKVRLNASVLRHFACAMAMTTRTKKKHNILQSTCLSDLGLGMI